MFLLSHCTQSSRETVMRNIFVRKQTALAAACALALGLLSANANSQARDVNEKALVTDSRGSVVTNATGQCWHSGFGPAPQWTRGCHAAVAVPVVAKYVAPVAQPAPAAQPIAQPAPAPAPAAVVAAAPLPVYEKVAFDANVLFDSNQSALRAAGRDTLDQFVAKIHGLDAQSIMAIGYADRMGSEGSNQILSEERVEAVKAYLVGKGIAASRVKTSAWGETRPDTVRGDCKDANTTHNVACMQPDRHVFIEVSGTRLAKTSQ
jgi:OOP family OmpA-OmpF porin